MKRIILLLAVIAFAHWLAGCSAGKSGNVHNTGPRPALADRVQPRENLSIDHIQAFQAAAASRQALEVVQSNPYSQDFFEKVFARLVDQCAHSKSGENADIIWDNFVQPLSRNGKVPPDLARSTWNAYFSRNFVSLPRQGHVTSYCHRLDEIKTGLEKEYQFKTAGFESSGQGSPDAHFLNAMYVYNTMWAACREPDTSR